MTLDELTFGGPHRIAQIRYIKDDGEYHREVRAPGADLSDLPTDERTKIEAEWTPEVVAAYHEATKEVQPEPEPLPEPDPIAAKIAAIEATVTLLRTRIDKLDGGDVLTTRR